MHKHIIVCDVVDLVVNMGFFAATLISSNMWFINQNHLCFSTLVYFVINHKQNS